MLLEPQALLSGVKNGNRLMFTLCYDRYHRGIYLFVLKYVRCEALAEDIVQETFITVWENKKIYNSYQGLKAYLYELVQNKCTNYLKHKQVEDKYVSFVKTTGEETEGD